MRLFVAFDLPQDVRDILGECIARLRQDAVSAKWMRPEALHVTLKFIGHVPEDMLSRIRAAVEPVRSSAPVEMQFRGIGFFPNDHRPRVIWCGVAASLNLASLAADVDAALEPLGIATESRAFLPHLTLARFKGPGNIAELREAASKYRDREFGSVRASEFHLFESFLKPSGAEYKNLAAFPFTLGAA